MTWRSLMPTSARLAKSVSSSDLAVLPARPCRKVLPIFDRKVDAHELNGAGSRSRQVSTSGNANVCTLSI
jgi:hypothetical protein